MFRKMRRAERELPEGQAKEILENGSYGVLALAGDGGYPYAVPLNYVYDGERIYFHCAAEGHKIDAIARDNKCSFCVVENGGVIEDRFTTKYRFRENIRGDRRRAQGECFSPDDAVADSVGNK